MIDFKESRNFDNTSMNKPSVSSVKSEEKFPNIVHLKQKPFKLKKKPGHKLINNVLISDEFKKDLRSKYCKKNGPKDRYSKFHSRRQGMLAVPHPYR